MYLRNVYYVWNQYMYRVHTVYIHSTSACGHVVFTMVVMVCSRDAYHYIAQC